MRLAVSNIAWPADQRDAAYALLCERGISGLEIAPGLLLAGASDPFEPSARELEEALAPVRAAGLQLVSMQSLLFGVTGAALFGTAAEREALQRAMQRALALAQRLGIPNLVFGSPRQRAIPVGLDRARAEAIAIDTFRGLGDAAVAADTRIAIEPNAATYGTNFLNRIEEAEAFVRLVDHPGIALNFDIGALHNQGDFERIGPIAQAAADCIAHVHFSEAGLTAAPADSKQAAQALLALERTGYSGWYSIEMAAAPDALDALADAIARLQAAVAAVQSDRSPHASR
ncbi:hypothetical protein BH10PSE13_BH10PSE13_11260 [soil metagenome]